MLYTTIGGMRRVVGWLDSGIQPVVCKIMVDKELAEGTNIWPQEANEALAELNPLVVIAISKGYVFPYDVIDSLIRVAHRYENTAVFVGENGESDGGNYQITTVFLEKVNRASMRILGSKITEFEEVMNV
jgi:hypothetical protein